MQNSPMHRNLRKHMTCLKTTFVLEAYVLIIFLYSNASEQNISSSVIIRLLEKCSKGERFYFFC